jgi:hypothetical protein
MCIGTDGIECCHDQVYRDMWIGKDVKGNFQDQFEIIYALQQI